MNSKLETIQRLVWQMNHDRILITIDGPCGSGKTTLAQELAAVMQATIVHTDDFVIPHAQKTIERLAIPGGNEDADRIVSEVLRPWKQHGTAIYRPYLCMEDRMGAPVATSSAHILILEGTYSNLPVIRSMADIMLWVDTPEVIRLQRLESRVGKERMKMFHARWIPLERAYFEAYGLPDSSCVIIQGE